MKNNGSSLNNEEQLGTNPKIKIASVNMFDIFLLDPSGADLTIAFSNLSSSFSSSSFSSH